MNTDRNIETFDFLKEHWPLDRVLKGLIVLNDISLKELAYEAGINKANMWSTCNRWRNHPKSMAAISRKLGIPSRELFDGKR